MKMRKILMITQLVFLVVAVPCVAAAQDCQYHTFKIDLATATYLDPPTAPYDGCLEVSKVVGTLNGTYRVCFYSDDFIPSSDIFLDDFPLVLAEKLYVWVSTKKGDIEGPAWGWKDTETGIETGFAKITGGTGDFEDVTGYLTYSPRLPNLGTVNLIEGFLCSPED